MPWYAWGLILYFVLDVFATVLMVGREHVITRGVLFLVLITHTLGIAAVLALAGSG
jgi:hypothetical protein